MNDYPRLELLAIDHGRALERFERTNRAFFAEHVGDRGDDFFEYFDERLAARVREIHERVSLFFVILDEDGEVLGRVNISNIDRPESTELGFRVAEDAQGRGIARQSVTTALEVAASHGVTTVKARVSTENLTSHRVLHHCGFEQTGQTEAPNASLNFIGYRKDLGTK